FFFFHLDLQTTANGIRQDFKSALDKYNKYQQEKLLLNKTNTSITQPSISKINRSQQNNIISQEKNLSSTKIQNGNIEQRPIRYPAEDIRFKNKPQQENIVPIPVTQQIPLVSNVYQDDDEDEDDDALTEQNM
ncbi:unnamed protein product, partial [Rotaria sordida]